MEDSIPPGYVSPLSAGEDGLEQRLGVWSEG